AYSVLFDLATKINQLKANNNMRMANSFSLQLRQLGNILGFLTKNPEKFLQNRTKISHKSEMEKIEKLIKQRNDARKNKLWEQADLLRHELTKMNILLEDGPKGTIWYCK
ncbi:MAG: CysS/YqeB C-terminal domain-containing protein, partial [Arsenophonus sp. ET-DL12-MAG3]